MIFIFIMFFCTEINQENILEKKLYTVFQKSIFLENFGKKMPIMKLEIFLEFPKKFQADRQF